MREAGRSRVPQDREALSPVVLELELAPGLVDDGGGTGDVPHLPLEVVVAAEHALSEPVVEAAEVAPALAVHPPEILELVLTNRGVDGGETERAARQPSATVVEASVRAVVWARRADGSWM